MDKHHDVSKRRNGRVTRIAELVRSGKRRGNRHWGSTRHSDAHRTVRRRVHPPILRIGYRRFVRTTVIELERDDVCPPEPRSVCRAGKFQLRGCSIDFRNENVSLHVSTLDAFEQDSEGRIVGYAAENLTTHHSGCSSRTTDL